MNIPYYVPSITKSEIAAATRVMKSGFMASGPEVKALEEEYSKHCDYQYCVAVSSATAGLYLVCKYMKRYHGWTEVNIPAYTFCATKQAADSAGLKTIVLDVDYDYRICNNEYDSKNIEVAFAGNDNLLDVANIRLPIKHDIIDMAHCFPCQYHLTRVYSFYSTKPLAGSGGGMIVTSDKDLADWARKMRQHGREESVGHSENPRGIGFNFWLSDLSAAIVREQLKRIDYLKSRREEIARMYVDGLKGIDLYYGDHLAIIRTEKRSKIENAFKEKGIFYSRPYIPLDDEKNVPNAWRLYNISISLPYYTSLKKKEIDLIISTINDIV